ncbi:hypothetical protein SUGI_0015800 [Cryptomeria japonica]|nr:hypothetical protein SUGI_0015800 [Cryptomeria japonica]
MAGADQFVFVAVMVVMMMAGVAYAAEAEASSPSPSLTTGAGFAMGVPSVTAGVVGSFIAFLACFLH